MSFRSSGVELQLADGLALVRAAPWHFLRIVGPGDGLLVAAAGEALGLVERAE